MSKKSFVRGAAVLAVSGLIVKVIGAVFRIPLTNIIGSEGIGIYQLAYPIYAFLLVASTAGLPVAISKMVSEEIAMGNHREAHRIFRISLRLLTIIGVVTTVILLACSGLIARIQGNPKSIYALMAIAPALLFVSVMSAYRGYFQGMHIMYPTALSQIVEQIGKLVLGLTFAAMWLARGSEFAAAGAIAGVTLSEVAAMALILGIYRGRKREIWKRVVHSPKGRYRESSKSIVSRIIRIAVPVTLGASIMPLVNFADQIIVVNRLKNVIDQVPGLPMEAGSTELATRLYGLLTGAANTLINFPAVLTTALAMSLVPAISESFALKDSKGVGDKTTVGVRLTLLVGLPAAVGLAVLADPIIRVLYRTFEVWEYNHAASILSTLSIGVVFLTLIQSLTAILQGVSQVAVPVRNLFIGATPYYTQTLALM